MDEAYFCFRMFLALLIFTICCKVVFLLQNSTKQCVIKKGKDLSDGLSRKGIRYFLGTVLAMECNRWFLSIKSRICHGVSRDCINTQ